MGLRESLRKLQEQERLDKKSQLTNILSKTVQLLPSIKSQIFISLDEFPEKW